MSALIVQPIFLILFSHIIIIKTRIVDYIIWYGRWFIVSAAWINVYIYMWMETRSIYIYHWNTYAIKSNLILLCTSYACRSSPMPEEWHIHRGGDRGGSEPTDICAGIWWVASPLNSWATLPGSGLVSFTFRSLWKRTKNSRLILN